MRDSSTRDGRGPRPHPPARPRAAVLAGLVLFLPSLDALAQPMGPSPKATFAGAWRVVEATAAPWVKPHTLTRDETPLLTHALSFERGEVRGPSPVGCAHATYGTVVVPPKGLFQGSLPEGQEAAVAKALGLGPPDAATLRVDCDTGTFDYHLDNQGRLVFALSDVVYTMQRPKGR